MKLGNGHVWIMRINELRSSLLMISRSFWYRRGYVPSEVEPGSYPFPKRQVPLCGKLSFQERINNINSNAENRDANQPVDIGISPEVKKLLPHRPQEKRLELESAARKHTLRIPIELIHSVQEDTHAPSRRLLAARHFDIFKSLFGSTCFFVPHIPLRVYYVNEVPVESALDVSSVPRETDILPVHTGNLIAATHASKEPFIELPPTFADHRWTIVMTCPDEPIDDPQCETSANEYVHWIVSNLKPSETDDGQWVGDTILPYIQPLPYVGTGFHRYIFTLYRQNNGVIDLTSLKQEKDVKNLKTSRAFNSLEFYRNFHSQLTPAGLAFFQSSWDNSVRSFYRNVLDTPEPIFELEWPAPRLPPQSKFPVANSWCRPRRHPHGIPLIRERYGVHSDVSFDVYLDRYRDKKDLAEEIVRERLRMEGNPLDPHDPRRKRVEYPAALPMPPNMPSWWLKQEMQRRLRLGRWQYLEGHDG